MGISQNLICSMQKKDNLCRNFQNILLFNLFNVSKPQKLSAKPNCFWELGSRVPPLFPALGYNVSDSGQGEVSDPLNYYLSGRSGAELEIVVELGNLVPRNNSAPQKVFVALSL